MSRIPLAVLLTIVIVLVVTYGRNRDSRGPGSKR
jgi:hypothetical protein